MVKCRPENCTVSFKISSTDFALGSRKNDAETGFNFDKSGAIIPYCVFMYLLVKAETALAPFLNEVKAKYERDEGSVSFSEAAGDEYDEELEEEDEEDEALAERRTKKKRKSNLTNIEVVDEDDVYPWIDETTERPSSTKKTALEDEPETLDQDLPSTSKHVGGKRQKTRGK